MYLSAGRNIHRPLQFSTTLLTINQCTMGLSIALRISKVTRRKGSHFAQSWSKSSEVVWDRWKTAQRFRENFFRQIFVQNVILMDEKHEGQCLTDEHSVDDADDAVDYWCCWWCWWCWCTDDGDPPTTSFCINRNGNTAMTILLSCPLAKHARTVTSRQNPTVQWDWRIFRKKRLLP